MDLSPYNGTPGFMRNAAVGQHRFKTDISAPGGGDTVVMASPVRRGSPQDTFGGAAATGINKDPNFAGTSFAAPHVSAAAALMDQFGAVKGFSTDHRVIKALLLNGATNTGVTLNNGAAWAPLGSVGTKPARAPGIRNGTDVFIGWNADLGTGLLDAGRSLVNYNAGQMAPGNVNLVGWDLRAINGQGTVNEYDFNRKISEVHATLTWDRFVMLQDRNGDNLWQPGETFNASPLNDLDLELWDLTKNVRQYYSTSDADNIEYISYQIPRNLQGDAFALRIPFVRDFRGAGTETYGLAWSATPVPEPGTLVLLGIGLASLGYCRRLRRRRESRR